MAGVQVARRSLLGAIQDLGNSPCKRDDIGSVLEGCCAVHEEFDHGSHTSIQEGTKKLEVSLLKLMGELAACLASLFSPHKKG